MESKKFLNTGLDVFSPNTYAKSSQPKTTTNPQGQLVLVGTYSVE
jgi:hypothetical protein